MNRIRNSRALKILALIIFVLSFVGAGGNILLAVFMEKSNINYAEKNQYAEMIYSEVLNHVVSDDITTYFMMKEHNDPANDITRTQLELLEQKYSRGKTNLSFSVIDKENNVLLTNFSIDAPAYSFTKEMPYYITSSWDEPGTTEMAAEKATVPPDAEDTVTAAEVMTTVPETSTAPENPGSTELAVENRPHAKALSFAADHAKNTEETTCFDITEPSSMPEEHYYLLTGDNYSEYGQAYKFRYVYEGDNYNDKILNYCIDLYENGDYWDNGSTSIVNNWVVFRENNYAVSENGVVYSLYDWAIPTTMIDEYEPKLPTAIYNVRLALPAKMEAKDLFYYTAKFIDLSYSYINALLPITILFSVLAIASFIWLIFSAGYVKNLTEPAARGLHRIPGDIAFVVAAAAEFAAFIITDELVNGDIYWPFIVLFSVVTVFILMFCLLTLIVRIRTKTLFSNLFIIYLLKKAAGLFRKASENINLLWKTGLIFLLVTVLEFVYSVLVYNSSGFIILLILVKILEVPFVILLTINLNTVQNGAEKLSKGDLSGKIQSKYLFGEFRKNAAYLNSISDGVNREVAERMKSESMKTELITNVSHDLKTPLTSIINYVDLLKGTGIKDPKAKEYIDVIDRQSQKLKKLCSDVVDASKAATGNIDVKKEKTILNVLLSQVAGEYDERLKKNCLQLICTLPEEDLAIMADGKLLWRVFDNLMNNICKYAMSGTRVYLSLSGSGGIVNVIFRNISGSPLNISPAELTERFVRGDESRNTEGSGLGLSIAKSLTELMGGKFGIGIDGDLFKVTLSFTPVD